MSQTDADATHEEAYKLETLAVHAGVEPDPVTSAVMTPSTKPQPTSSSPELSRPESSSQFVC